MLADIHLLIFPLPAYSSDLRLPYDESARILNYCTAMRKRVLQNSPHILRFERSYVNASEIAEQFYCEKSMELAKIYGKEPTIQMERGTQGHENVLKGSVPITEEETYEHIFSGSYVTMREISLIGEYNQVQIRGRADLILFGAKNPILIGDYKFKDRPYIYDNELVQLRVYCFLLHCMGFDLSKTRYAVISPHTDLRDNSKVNSLHNHILEHGIVGSKEIEFGDKIAKLEVRQFDMKKVANDLDFALGYWLKLRDAKPTKNPNKCRVCKFKDRCEFSLA